MSDSLLIACSLDGDTARRRWAAWKGLISRRESADRSPPDLTVTFQPGDYLADTLHVLLAAERRCCGFVDRELEDDGSHFVLTVRGNAKGVGAMAESFGLG